MLTNVYDHLVNSFQRNLRETSCVKVKKNLYIEKGNRQATQEISIFLNYLVQLGCLSIIRDKSPKIYRIGKEIIEKENEVKNLIQAAVNTRKIISDL